MRFGECKHFTGLLRDTCNAGVKFDDVHVKDTPLCCCDGNSGGCDRYEEPTQAEIDADKQDDDRMISAMLAQFNKLQPTLEKNQTQVQGQGHAG